MHAWPEVRFRDIGWVPFAPFPLRTGDDAPPPPGQRAASAADPLRDAAADAVAAGRARQSPPSATRTTAAPPTGGAGVALDVMLSGVVLLVMLTAATVPIAKAARRRRRRRAPTATARVDGAWRETVDQLRQSGVRARPSLTRQEVARAAQVAHPRARLAALDQLRTLVDAAAFSGGPATDQDARRAWQLADQVRRQVSLVVPLRQRLAGHLDVRPLLRRPTVR